MAQPTLSAKSLKQQVQPSPFKVVLRQMARNQLAIVTTVGKGVAATVSLIIRLARDSCDSTFGATAESWGNCSTRSLQLFLFGFFFFQKLSLMIKKKCLKLNLCWVPLLFGCQLSVFHNEKQSSPKQSLLSCWDYTHPPRSYTTFKTSRTSRLQTPFKPISTHLQHVCKMRPCSRVHGGAGVYR